MPTSGVCVVHPVCLPQKMGKCMQCMGFLLKGFFCVAENIMAGSRGQFFTVSEALQAKDSDCEEHTWDEEDEVDISPTTTLPLSPVPSTSAVVQEEIGPRSSTPKRKLGASSQPICIMQLCTGLSLF